MGIRLDPHQRMMAIPHWTDSGVMMQHAGRLGAANWWDPNNDGLCVWAAYQAKGAASFLASLVDLSGNGNDAVDPGGANTPGWDGTNGWTFDGIQQYLATTFVPQNDQSQSWLGQFTGWTASTAFDALWGVNEGGGRYYRIVGSFGASIYYGQGNQVLVSAWRNSGNYGISGGQGYYNGIADGGVIAPSASAVTLPFYIGCHNAGAPGNFAAYNLQAYVIYDCAITAPQMLAVATAMAAR